MERLHCRAIKWLKRPLRFSLTTLLTLVAVAAFIFAHVGNRIHAVRGAINSIVNARGHVMVASPDDWWHRNGVGDYSDRIYAVSFRTWRGDGVGNLEDSGALVGPWEISDVWFTDIELYFMMETPQGAKPRPSDADDETLRRLAAVGTDVLLLDLGTPLITDVGASHLCKFSNLRCVSLFGSAITDQGVQAIGDLPYLQNIDLSQTAVTDAALEGLGRLPRLTQLNVSGTKVTPEAIRALKRSRPDLSVSPDPDDSTDVYAPPEGLAEAIEGLSRPMLPRRAGAIREIRTSR